MSQITLIVNKNWEVEPIINALTNSEIRPFKLPFPETINSPRNGNNKMNIPRAEYIFSDSGVQILKVSIWCIQDLMYYNIPSNQTQSSSSSEEKYRVLLPLIQAENPDLVVAIGTAGYPSEMSLNGSIVIGGNFFIYNGHPNNPRSNLMHPDVGKILSTKVNERVFNLIDKDFKSLVESKFIKTPKNPASQNICIASKAYTAISSINVTDYSEYNWVDHEAIESFHQIEHKLPFNSLETTHGVIKLSTNKPVIFISAITDKIGNFDIEVTATQNYVASFNAGIVLGQLICSLNDFLLQGHKF